MSKERYECLNLSRTGTELIIENECDHSLRLEAVEVKYYVTGALAYKAKREEEALKRARRIITERITVGKELKPNTRISLYFGITENIEEVVAEVTLPSGRKLRVKLT